MKKQKIVEGFTIKTYVVIGLAFGLIISFFTALLFMLFAQTISGGVTMFWGEKWLYFSVIVPFAIAFAILGGYFHNRKELSNKKLWKISFICAFIVTLYSGTAGAIFGETIARGGLETINIEGTLIWGNIYAVVLLPLTTPFSRFLIIMFLKLLKKGETYRIRGAKLAKEVDE